MKNKNKKKKRLDEIREILIFVYNNYLFIIRTLII